MMIRNLALYSLCGLLLLACGAQDECLDAGGRWNEQNQSCEK